MIELNSCCKCEYAERRNPRTQSMCLDSANFLIQMTFSYVSKNKIRTNPCPFH